MAATYKIGEAAALLNLKSYVLRFWETEFPEIAPLRTEKGQRLYTPEHLALLDRIRYLLHERGLTIGGARKVLAEERARGLTYVFGAKGGVRGLDAEVPVASGQTGATAPSEEAAPSRADATASGETNPAAHSGTGAEAHNLTGAAAHSREALLSPEEEAALLEDADPESDDENPDADSEEAAWAANAPQAFDAADGPVQFNLPGLEDMAAFRFSLLKEKPGLDSAGREGYGGTEEAANKPNGMLPLFAVARAAFLAGKASAGTGPASLEGGGNFIRAEAPVGRADRTGASAGREDMRAVAFELEAIAALLRAQPPKPREKEGRDV